jgi:hypothetical protein
MLPFVPLLLGLGTGLLGVSKWGSGLLDDVAEERRANKIKASLAGLFDPQPKPGGTGLLGADLLEPAPVPDQVQGSGQVQPRGVDENAFGGEAGKWYPKDYADREEQLFADLAKNEDPNAFEQGMNANADQMMKDMAGPPVPVGVVAKRDDPTLQEGGPRGSGLLGAPDRAQSLQIAQRLMGTPFVRETGNKLLEGLMTQYAGDQGAGERAAMADERALAGQLMQQRHFEEESKRLAKEFEQNVIKFGTEHAFRVWKENNDQLIANRQVQVQEAHQRFLERGLPPGVRAPGDGFSPTGERTIVLPDGRAVQQYAEGSKGYEERAGALDSLALMATQTDRMIKILQQNKHGVTGTAEGEVQTLYSDIVSQMGKLRELGTLQQGDLEFIQRALPNPSEIKNLATSDPRMIASFQELLKQIDQRYRNSSARFAVSGVRGSMAFPDVARAGEGGKAAAPKAPPAGFEVEGEAPKGGRFSTAPKREGSR